MTCYVCKKNCGDGWAVPVDEEGKVTYSLSHQGVSMPVCEECYEQYMVIYSASLPMQDLFPYY